MRSRLTSIQNVLNRNLVFVHGKGGVGKTVVSKAIALSLSERKEKTLWVSLENPTLPAGQWKQVNPSLWHFNCDFQSAFEEYVTMKIGAAKLTRIFLQNKLTKSLSRAAPGLKELVLLGKIWFERTHYSHVVIDLPSTGYGLAMFQSTENFARLFRGGPLNRDAEMMLGTFRDPATTGHLIVALPEEMPLQESIELNGFLKEILPENRAAFIVNRIFPQVDLSYSSFKENPKDWPSPIASSAIEYSQKRYLLEKHNLRLWRDHGIEYGELEYIPPEIKQKDHYIPLQLSEKLKHKALI